jgi:hypothetical protein
LANLNETNITNGLSVDGGITVDDLGKYWCKAIYSIWLI